MCASRPPISWRLCPPDLVRTERYHIEVETRGQFTRGMTIADRRPSPAQEPTVYVAVEVDHRRFVDEFMDSVLWWARRGDYH